VSLLSSSNPGFDPEAQFAIVEFRGCRFASGKQNKLEAALRLPRDRHGRERYDRLNFSVIEQIVGAGDVCFDIGANIGIYSCVMARMTRNPGGIHSFEPANHIRQKLMRNLRLNSFDDVRVNAFGLGAEETEKDFFEIRQGVTRGGVSSFVQNENYAALGAENYETRRVPVRTLDGYVDDLDLTALKLMKIDVEGFEIDVIRGAKRTIERFRPFILLEFDTTRHAGDADEMRAFFGSLGYDGFDPYLQHGKLGFNEWSFETTPRERNALLVP
jgi:FkbM family methyltransferase